MLRAYQLFAFENQQGPFATKNEAMKASDAILKSFPDFDPRELNNISEVSRSFFFFFFHSFFREIKTDLEKQHEQEKADLLQNFEEKFEVEKEIWKAKEKEYESRIEGLEMQIAIDGKPRGKLADMLKTLHMVTLLLKGEGHHA